MQTLGGKKIIYVIFFLFSWNYETINTERLLYGCKFLLFQNFFSSYLHALIHSEINTFEWYMFYLWLCFIGKVSEHECRQEVVRSPNFKVRKCGINMMWNFYSHTHAPKLYVMVSVRIDFICTRYTDEYVK